MQLRAYLISGGFRVHRADCRDCQKEARRSDSAGNAEEFPSKAAVISDLWSDIIAEDPGFYGTPGGWASLEAETIFLPCTSGLPGDCPAPRPAAGQASAPGGETAAPDRQIARDRIKGNPVIIQMAAGVATVPLADLADEDGTPRFAFMQRANRAFDTAEAQNADNLCYEPYPAGAPRHPGLIAEAVLAERAAIREAIASAMASPGTSPESTDVTAIIERLRAGESPVVIARETGALP